MRCTRQKTASVLLEANVAHKFVTPHRLTLLKPVQKDGEIALFGGEFFDSDTDRQLVYGDLFVFNCSKERWWKVVVPHRRAPQVSSLCNSSHRGAIAPLPTGPLLGVRASDEATMQT